MIFNLRRWWRRRKIKWARTHVSFANIFRNKLPVYRDYNIYHNFISDLPQLGEWSFNHYKWEIGDDRHGVAYTFKECLDKIDELEDNRNGKK